MLLKTCKGILPSDNTFVAAIFGGFELGLLVTEKNNEFESLLFLCEISCLNKCFAKVIKIKTSQLIFFNV